LCKYHALVDDDDGGCDEESKINDIGIEHSDVDDDEEEEEDVDRFQVHSVCKATLCKSYSLNWHCHDISHLHLQLQHCPEKLKRALRVAEALRYPFIFVVILWAAISTISCALDVNDNESDFSIQFV